MRPTLVVSDSTTTRLRGHPPCPPPAGRSIATAVPGAAAGGANLLAVPGTDLAAGSETGTSSVGDAEKSVVLVRIEWEGCVQYPTRTSQWRGSAPIQVTSSCTGWFASEQGHVVAAQRLVDAAVPRCRGSPGARRRRHAPRRSFCPAPAPASGSAGRADATRFAGLPRIPPRATRALQGPACSHAGSARGSGCCDCGTRLAPDR